VNPLLLADRSPSLRLRALTELADGEPSDDAEVARLRSLIAASPQVDRALAERPEDSAGLGFLLCRLAYLRYTGPEVEQIAEELFDRQLPDGSWPLWLDKRPDPGRRRGRQRTRPRNETYTTIPIQTALPLRGLAAAGYARDARAERGYEYLLRQRLDDGSWLGDRKADLPASEVPGYRRLPGSDGCRTNTTAAVACLALHPQRRASDAARQGLGHLLSAATRQEWSLGVEVARLCGLEPARGRLTFYARSDLALLLDLASRCAGPGEPGVADLVAVIEGLRGPYGLWLHPARPQLSRWLSLDLDSSLARLNRGVPYSDALPSAGER